MVWEDELTLLGQRVVAIGDAYIGDIGLGYI